MLYYQYRDSHYKDMTVSRPSYKIPYLERLSIYWDKAQGINNDGCDQVLPEYSSLRICSVAYKREPSHSKVYQFYICNIRKFITNILFIAKWLCGNEYWPDQFIYQVPISLAENFNELYLVKVK